MNQQPGETVPSSGSLETVPFPDLLESLMNQGLTGTLALRQDGVVKAVYLERGEVVFATSSLKSERLGEILLRQGTISASALKAITKTMRETGKREGETMVEMGILAPKALFHSLKYQVEEIIISLFLWDSGHYRFIPGTLPPNVVPLPVDLGHLLPKAIDRLRR